MKSFSSSYKLWYLTLKPFVILLSIILQNIYNLVLEYGGRSFIQKSIIQIKSTMIYLYHFQLSLNRIEIIGEIGILILLIGFYYFQRWLYQQTYWTRITSYTKEKKQKIIKVRYVTFYLYFNFGCDLFGRLNRINRYFFVIH